MLVARQERRMTNSRCQEVTGASRPTAKRDLENLVSKGGSCVTRVQRPAALATVRSSYLAGNRPNDGLTWRSLHSGYT
jgi:Fic family protein